MNLLCRLEEQVSCRGASHTCPLPSCHCSARNSKGKGPSVGDTNCWAANDISLWDGVDRRERGWGGVVPGGRCEGGRFVADMATSQETHAWLRVLFLSLLCPASRIGKNLEEKSLRTISSFPFVLSYTVAWFTWMFNVRESNHKKILSISLAQYSFCLEPLRPCTSLLLFSIVFCFLTSKHSRAAIHGDY